MSLIIEVSDDDSQHLLSTILADLKQTHVTCSGACSLDTNIIKQCEQKLKPFSARDKIEGRRKEKLFQPIERDEKKDKTQSYGQLSRDETDGIVDQLPRNPRESPSSMTPCIFWISYLCSSNGGEA